MGYWTIFGAGRLPLGCSIFSNTYNPVEAADSKPPFFRFEFVNRFRRKATSPPGPPADNTHSLRTRLDRSHSRWAPDH